MGEKGRKYLDKGIASHESFLRRFSDYHFANSFIKYLNKNATIDKRFPALVADATQVVSNNLKLKRARTGSGKVTVKATALSDARSYSLGMKKESDNLLAIVKVSFSDSSDSFFAAVATFKILTQCLFCNRFHLQDPKPKLDRCCDRPKCTNKKDNWKQSYKNRVPGMTTVSPSGF